MSTRPRDTIEPGKERREKAGVGRRKADTLKSLEDYRAIFDYANDGIFVHNLETGDVIAINRKATEMYGYSLEEFRHFIDESFFAGVPGYTAQDAMEKIRSAAEGSPQVFEWLSKRKDGRLFWVEVNLKTALIGGESRLLAVVRDITDRKNIEREIQSAKEQCEEAQRIAGIGSWEWDCGTNKLTWSDEVYHIFNLRKGEFKETVQAFLEMVHPEDRPRIQKRLAEADASPKETFFNEYRIVRPDGSVRILNTRSRLQYDSSGILTGMRGTAQDVTDARRDEQNLKLTQFSVDHASVSAFLIAKDARLLYVNEEACRMLGYTRDELLQMRVGDLDPDSESEWEQHWSQLRESGRVHFERRHRKKDGSLIPVLISGNYVSFEGQEYNWAFGIDISERKRVEEELARMSRQNELILESAGDGILGMNREGTHILVNTAAIRMLGFGRVELMGRHSHSIWHHTRADGSPYPEEECEIYKTSQDGVSRHIDHEVFWKKDGTSIPVEYTTTAISEGKKIVGTVVTFRDIAERRRTEEALRESEERFRTLADNIAQLVWMADAEGRRFWYNRRWYDYTGTTIEEMSGWGWRKVIHPDHVEGVAEKISRCFETGESWEDTSLLRGKDGHYRWFLSRSVPIRNEQGKVIRWFGTNTDITDRKRVEEELEGFTYSVSHDLKAPIRHMSSYADLLKDEAWPVLSEQGRQYLTTILNASRKMGILVDELLDFSRMGRKPIKKDIVDLNALIREAIQSLSEETKDRSIKWRIVALPSVTGDSLMLHLVFLNLIGNALKFTRTRGEAVIAIESFESESEHIVSVSDNGVGFDMKYYAKLFGVFQRLHSHKEFEGTGIGLANVKRIIQRHGGRVWAEAKTDEGAVFYVALPRRSSCAIAGKEK